MRELLTSDELLKKFQISRTTLFRWVKAGSFPSPVRIGRRTIRWRADEIDEFVKSRSRDMDEVSDCWKDSRV